ncbi:MAG TPA: hypothetical protein VNP04_01315 [Alphaproteobacteria bacterium]|nr:hypothetical protein [Alphaproteobacteria bacterium]
MSTLQLSWNEKAYKVVGRVPIHLNHSIFGRRTSREERIARKISKDKYHLQEIESMKIPYWFPDDNFDIGREMVRYGFMKRGIKRLDDLYTKRNLWAMACLWNA